MTIALPVSHTPYPAEELARLQRLEAFFFDLSVEAEYMDCRADARYFWQRHRDCIAQQEAVKQAYRDARAAASDRNRAFIKAEQAHPFITIRQQTRALVDWTPGYHAWLNRRNQKSYAWQYYESGEEELYRCAVVRYYNMTEAQARCLYAVHCPDSSMQNLQFKDGGTPVWAYIKAGRPGAILLTERAGAA